MTLRGHDDKIRSVAFSPDGRRIFSTGRDNKIKLWDAESGTELMTLAAHNHGVAAFSPDGQLDAGDELLATVGIVADLPGTEQKPGSGTSDS